MKKALCLMIALCFLMPAVASANYTVATKQAVAVEISEFYKRNLGNRITVDLMDGLLLHINTVFDKNVVEPPSTPKAVVEPFDKDK